MKNLMLALSIVLLSTPAFADLPGAVVNDRAAQADLIQIWDNAAGQYQGINWAVMVRSTMSAVNWQAIVQSSNTVNWAQVVLPTAP